MVLSREIKVGGEGSFQDCENGNAIFDIFFISQSVSRLSRNSPTCGYIYILFTRVSNLSFLSLVSCFYKNALSRIREFAKKSYLFYISELLSLLGSHSRGTSVAFRLSKFKFSLRNTQRYDAFYAANTFSMIILRKRIFIAVL